MIMENKRKKIELKFYYHYQRKKKWQEISKTGIMYKLLA